MRKNNLENASLTDNWRICIYGKPGVGKTTAIKNLKGKTYILDLDNSTKVLAGQNIDIFNFDRNKPQSEIVEFLNSLSEIEQEYDNLVIDNISSFEKDWFIERGKNSKSKINNEIQDYSAWNNYFPRVISAIYRANINVLITAWENQVPFTTIEGQQFMQYQPEIRDGVRDMFMGLTDIVGRLMINPKTNSRGVILQGNDGIFAKNRLDNRESCKVEELFDFV